MALRKTKSIPTPHAKRQTAKNLKQKTAKQQKFMKKKKPKIA